MKSIAKVFQKCPICRRGRMRLGENRYTEWYLVAHVDPGEVESLVCERCRAQSRKSTEELSLKELNRLGKIAPRYNWRRSE